MENYHLNQTVEKLKGPTNAQLVCQNQWAAVALDKFHDNSNAEIEFSIDGVVQKANLNWDSSFSKAAMKEKTEAANQGGVAMAMFVMSVLQDYGYVEQSEIGEGVDYRFMKTEPTDDDLNFLESPHYVEVSGVLQESRTNTLNGRVKIKHDQIKRGARSEGESSVIVTLFSQPKTVKEVHQ
jgi:hypothetical protein